MYIAKAMYRGGELIVDPSTCDYYSFLKEGLLCPVCNQPVYLKKGHARKAHFAHFPCVESKQVEECMLKSTIYSNQDSLNALTFKGRGQRLKIFQERFLNLIANNDLSFLKKIQFIENAINCEFLEKITEESLSLFRKREQLSKEQCRTLLHFENGNKPLLQIEITCEAITYLSLDFTTELLKKIIYYSIYELGDSNGVNWNFLEKNINVEGIYIKIIDILINTFWLKAFQETEKKLNIKNIENTKKDMLFLTKEEKTTKTKKQENFFDLSFLMDFKTMVLFRNKRLSIHCKIKNKVFSVALKDNSFKKLGKVNWFMEEITQWQSLDKRFSGLTQLLNRNINSNPKQLIQLLAVESYNSRYSFLLINKDTVICVDKKKKFSKVIATKKIVDHLSRPKLTIFSVGRHSYEYRKIVASIFGFPPEKEGMYERFMNVLIYKIDTYIWNKINVINREEKQKQLLMELIQKELNVANEVIVEYIAIALLLSPSGFWQNFSQKHLNCQVIQPVDMAAQKNFLINLPDNLVANQERKEYQINVIQQVIKEITGVFLKKKKV